MTHDTEIPDVSLRVAELLDEADVAPRSDLILLAHMYLVRTRRARWYGALGALLFTSGGWWFGTGEASTAMGLSIARFFAGYLVGSTLAERALAGFDRREVRSASLAPRTASSLIPLWERIAIWVALPLAAASPLLLLGDHPRGVSHVKSSAGFGFATAHWFDPAALIGISATAVLTLALCGVLTWRLTHRPLVLDDPETARLDLVMRRRSARAVAGASAALGLFLLAGICYLSADPLVSQVCTAVGNCHRVYTFPGYDDVQDAGGILMFIGLSVFVLARRRPRQHRNAVAIEL